MNSRTTLNLILVAIAVALGTLVLLEPGKTKPETHPLAVIDAKALTAITLKDRESIRFEKINGHWALAEPFKAPANEIRINQLIDIAQVNSEARYPADPANLAPFELDKPRAVLSLGETVFTFGGSDPINLRRYVQVGDSLHLVSDDFFHHLTAAATDYVDKKLLPDAAKIREIQLPGLKASLGADGKWTREPPVEGNGGMSDLLTLWGSARAIDIRREDKPVQGDTIRIGLSEGHVVEFVIVQREPDLVLSRPDLGLRYEITAETASQLLNQPKPVTRTLDTGKPEPVGQVMDNDLDTDETADEGQYQGEDPGEDGEEPERSEE